MSKSGYTHLTHDQRCHIYALKSSGFSQRAIDKDIGVSPSTISRELKRNTGKRGYRFKQANKKAKERRCLASSSARKMTSELISLIEQHLRDDQWSPEQISGRLAHSGIRISHETIYKHIWLDKSGW
jgi:IS30 family transposase